jgi:hypothetical protein
MVNDKGRYRQRPTTQFDQLPVCLTIREFMARARLRAPLQNAQWAIQSFLLEPRTQSGLQLSNVCLVRESPMGG